MGNEKYAPVCGLYCGSCEFLGKPCPGCGEVEGKPFWTSQIPSKVCPLHECCRNQKGWEHCGLCPELPCKAFLELRDPSMTDEEFQRSLDTRQTNLKRRAEIGTMQWLLEIAGS